MLNKKHLGIFLLGFGVLTGVLAVAMSIFSRGQSGLYLVMLAEAVGCAMVGSILVFSRLLDHFARPIVEEISADVKDDNEKLSAAPLLPHRPGGVLLYPSILYCPL